MKKLITLLLCLLFVLSGCAKPETSDTNTQTNYIPKEKEENIDVTEEAANKEISEMAKKYNMTEEDIKTSIGGMDAMIYDLKVRKAIDVMKGEK